MINIPVLLFGLCNEFGEELPLNAMSKDIKILHI